MLSFRSVSYKTYEAHSEGYNYYIEQNYARGAKGAMRVPAGFLLTVTDPDGVESQLVLSSVSRAKDAADKIAYDVAWLSK